MFVNPKLRNPHLEGDAFFWEGGSVGVLLSHGYTATTTEVRLLADFLHERGYTVAGPLLPGHGTTPYALNRCRWQDWVAAMEASYQAVAARCEKVFVGGESMGGLLALILASAHPEIAGVMTYAAALKFYAKLVPLLCTVLAPFIPMLDKGRGDGVPNMADGRWQGYDVDTLPAATQLLRLQKKTLARLHMITQPILITQGRLDTSVSSDAPKLISQGVRSPEKRVVWFERSTHCLLLDQEWEDAAALTLNFIQDVLAASA